MDALTDAVFLNEVRRQLQAALEAKKINVSQYTNLLEQAKQYLPSRQKRQP